MPQFPHFELRVVYLFIYLFIQILFFTKLAIPRLTEFPQCLLHTALKVVFKAPLF